MNSFRVIVISTSVYFGILLFVFAILTLLSLVSCLSLLTEILWRVITSYELPSLSTDRQNLMLIEKSALEELCQLDLRFEIIDDLVNVEELTVGVHLVHIQTCRYDVTPRNKTILLVHGMNTGPVYFRSIFRQLVEDGYDVYCISLPGFGLAHVSDKILSFTTEQLLTFYCQYFAVVIQKYFVNTKPTILGHSLGAYLSCYFYSRHPSLIQSFIFVNGIGLLPSLDTTGKYWSVLFKCGFPNRFARPFGRLLNLVLFTVAELTAPLQQRCMMRWNMAQMTCSCNYGDVLCAKFITFNFFYSYWNTPVAGFLLDNTHSESLNVHFVWGIDDPIIPCYAAKLVKDMSLCTNSVPFDLYYILGGGHDPIPFNEGKDFMCIFRSIMEKKILVSIVNDQLYLESMVIFNDVLHDKRGSVFDTSATCKHLNHLYSKLLEDDMFITKTEKSPFFVVENRLVIHSVTYRGYFQLYLYLKQRLK